MKSAIPSTTFHNGVSMPQLGFGVWKIDDKDVPTALATAFEAGYRSIDTAAEYDNEEGVGRGIKNSSLARDELFVTTKFWDKGEGYAAAMQAFDESLGRLDQTYVDLYLIHWPAKTSDAIAETWRAFEDLYSSKKARAIGVCNFKPHHFEALEAAADVRPMINQIELHPRFTQDETRSYCAEHDIRVESWSPLMRGGELLSEQSITDIARTHEKSPAQVVLRWHIQLDLVVIPKSITPERIRENIDIVDFELSLEEMAAISALNQDGRIGPDPDSSKS